MRALRTRPQLLVMWLKVFGLVAVAASAEMAIWQWFGKGYRRQEALQTIKLIPDSLAMTADQEQVALGATVCLNSRQSPFTRVVFFFDMRSSQVHYLDLQVHESISLAMSDKARWIAVGIHGHDPRILDLQNFDWQILPVDKSQAGDPTAMNQNKLDHWCFEENVLSCSNQTQVLAWSCISSKGTGEWEIIEDSAGSRIRSAVQASPEREGEDLVGLQPAEQAVHQLLQNLVGDVLELDGKWHRLDADDRFLAGISQLRFSSQ